MSVSISAHVHRFPSFPLFFSSSRESIPDLEATIIVIIECSVRCCVCEVSLEWETHNWTGSRQHINYTQTLRVDKKKCQGFAGGSLSAELSWLCKGRVNFSVKICTFICCGWKSRTERGYSCYKDMQLTQKSCTLNNSNRRLSGNFFPRKNRSFL